MSSPRERELKEKEIKRSTKLFNFIYFLIIVAISYFVSTLIMDQIDVYDVLGLYTTQLPMIKKPGTDIPLWVFQVILAFVIFSTLQFIIVFILGLIKGEEDEYADAARDQWR